MIKKWLKKNIYIYSEKDNNYWYSEMNYSSLLTEYQKTINLLENATNQPTQFLKNLESN